MNHLPQRLRAFLSEAGQRLHEVGLSNELGEAMGQLAGQVDQPCIVAVVGRMKAGKSTFINALLGEDLARVGVTETTATINYFRYGRSDPARPVRCYWQNGSVTEEDRAFAASLQGNDAEALRRASGIKYLEHHLLRPFLERVTIVDTPGTCAVVDEHVRRTAEFLGLQRQLRERHNAETARLGGAADAVIYLIGEVARATDQALLEELQEVSGGRARVLNAIGVLAKVDLRPEILSRRHELAERIGGQLKNSLNRVVPVSAGVERAAAWLRERPEPGTDSWLSALRRIPASRLEKLLDSEELFRELETADCPVGVCEREQLLGNLPWAVFTAMARAALASAFDPTATATEWRSLSGLDQLRDLLDRHFVRRSQLLRCHRVVNDARGLLDRARFKHLPEQRRHGKELRSRLERFLAFVRGAGGEAAVARELEDFLVSQSTLQGSHERAEAVWKDLDRRLAVLARELDEVNADFEGLLKLEDHAAAFRPAEVDELRCLFGLYALEAAERVPGKAGTSHLAARQQHWLRVSQEDANTARRDLAELALARYGTLLVEAAT